MAVKMLSISKAFRRFSTQRVATQAFDIGSSSDFVEGAVKKVEVGSSADPEIAVARVGGQPFAVSNRCPHYGAPMSAGFLDRYTLSCPWHIAEFDIRSGEMKSSPSLDSLKSYSAKDVNGRVVVEIPVDHLSTVSQPRLSSHYVKRNPANTSNYVIVGGGAAAQLAAETLRRAGYEGRITLLSKESQLPYDRTILSKNLGADPSRIGLRPQSFYDQYEIEVKLDSEVTKLDIHRKALELAGGASLKYDKVLIATGCRARIPKPYREAYDTYPNVFSIREVRDQIKAKAQLEAAENIVIVGASFLGLETAKSIKTLWPSKSIKVFEMDPFPLARAFGPEIAATLVHLHRNAGIEINVETGVEKIVAVDGRAIAVKTKSNEYKADAILLATGAEVTTEFVPEQLLNPDKSVHVDAFMQTLAPGVYAAGDIASFPSLLTETRQRIEHWKVAQDHGITAGLSMAGQPKAYTSAPFFWTNLYGNAGFVGFGYGSNWHWTKALNPSDVLTSPKFTVFYKGHKAIGASVYNIPNAVATLKVALERNLLPSAKQSADSPISYEEIVSRVKATTTCPCELSS